MAKVLTTGAVVQCPHQGKITFTSTATLRVGGHPVVLQTDLAAALIVCPQAQSPCVKIAGSQTSSTVRDAGTAVVQLTGLKTNIAACSIRADGHDLLQSD